ncbi:hypothetical protein BS78_04G014500 [Paspalum vaginatum]|nr:hypothetical protein BS78_04G014500 [Paspalum vaginatum]
MHIHLLISHHQHQIMEIMGSPRRQTTLILLLVVALIASQEGNNAMMNMIGAGTAAACGSATSNPEIRCAFRCLWPGGCNNCCKHLGFRRGDCVGFGCNCCGDEAATTRLGS